MENIPWDDLYLVFSIALIYILIKTGYNLIKLKKDGGNKLASFNYSSATKISGIVIFILGSVLNLFVFNFWTSLTFQILMVVMISRVLGPVQVYENGLYYQATFVPWARVSDVRDTGKNRLEVRSGSRVAVFAKLKAKTQLLKLITLNTNSKKKAQGSNQSNNFKDFFK